MESGWRKLAVKNFLIDLIFPKICVGCGRGGEHLCDNCQKSLAVDLKFISREQLGLEKSLDGLWRFWDYDQKLAKLFVKRLKYDFIIELKDEIGELLTVEVIEKIKSGLPGEVTLMPIPLHRRRQLWRGFNQAELIAGAIADKVDWLLEKDALKRIKNSKQQAKLKEDDREANVKGIFALNETSRDFPSRTAVLIDDVFTTGATMQEAARIVKQAGFLKVYGLVLAS